MSSTKFIASEVLAGLQSQMQSTSPPSRRRVLESEVAATEMYCAWFETGRSGREVMSERGVRAQGWERRESVSNL